MRRLAPLAGIAVLAASLHGSPAWAHAAHGTFVQWKTPDPGQQVSGEAFHITGTVLFGEGVKNWAVEVVAPPGHDRPSFGTVCEEAVGGAPRTYNFDCEWDTTAYPEDAGVSLNGDYVIRVRAENADRGAPSESHVDERLVTLVNPVAAPRDVRLSFADAAREATVSWAVNPEPDVIKYIVQQRAGNGPWQVAGETGPKVNRLTRKLASGSYTFQVAAVRPGAPGKTLQSPWSGPAAEPKQVVVPDAQAASGTTSTTGPGNDEVYIPTDDPGPGAPAPAAGSGDPAAPGSAAPAPSGPTSPYVTRIQPGVPGSVTSTESFGTPRAAAAAATARPAPKPKEVIEPDAPFSETLPYPKKEAPAAPVDEAAAEEPSTNGDTEELGFGGRITSTDDDRRAALVPLAGGLLLFVAAMWAWFVSRRSGDERYLEAE